MYIIGYITLNYMVKHDRLLQTLNVNQIDRNREKEKNKTIEIFDCVQ